MKTNMTSSPSKQFENLSYPYLLFSFHLCDSLLLRRPPLGTLQRRKRRVRCCLLGHSLFPVSPSLSYNNTFGAILRLLSLQQVTIEGDPYQNLDLIELKKSLRTPLVTVIRIQVFHFSLERHPRLIDRFRKGVLFLVYR